MSWLAIRLLLKGAAARLWGVAGAVGRWLVRDWRNAPLLMGWLLAAGFHFITVPALEREAGAAQAALAEEQRNHRLTEINYRTAAAEALRRAAANAARVRDEQSGITREIVDDYEKRLAALRTRFAAVVPGLVRRDAAARTDPGRAGAAGVPGTGAATGGADGAAAQAGLPAAGATGNPTCPAPWLTPEDALIASEQAIQLDALIDWALAQSRVPFNPEEAPHAGQ